MVMPALEWTDVSVRQWSPGFSFADTDTDVEV